jgi:hypothetical protein
MQVILLPGTEKHFRNSLENDLYIQEAFFTLKHDAFRLRVGRQKFETGTGHAFNPTDLFNQKNPIDPTYENDGIDAVRLAVNLAGRREFTFLLSPSLSRRPDMVARLAADAGRWSLAAQFTSIVRHRTDWTAVNNGQSLASLESGTSMDSFSRGFRWYQPALEFRRSGQRFDLYGEAGYAITNTVEAAGTLTEGERNHERLLLGVSPRLGENYRLVFEYMRLGEGTRGTVPISLNDMMAYNRGTILSTNKDTLFADAAWKTSRRVEFQFQTSVGTNHRTVYLNPWIHLTLGPGVRFSLAMYSCTGADDGAYANVGLGAFARLRWDF